MYLGCNNLGVWWDPFSWGAKTGQEVLKGLPPDQQRIICAKYPVLCEPEKYPTIDEPIRGTIEPFGQVLSAVFNPISLLIAGAALLWVLKEK